jgi:hypothetical protein
MPGTYTAQPRDTLDVDGLVTGVTLPENERIIIMCGYSPQLFPFVNLLYDYTATDFFGGNKRKIGVTLPFHQVEGIAFGHDSRFYITNELVVQPPIINVPPKLHLLDLDAYLGGYIDSISSVADVTTETNVTIVYPNPATNFVTIESKEFPFVYKLVNAAGETVLEGTLPTENPGFSVTGLKSGVYFLRGGNFNGAMRCVLW